MIELLACSTHDVADIFLILIRRNNCGGLRTNLGERIALSTQTHACCRVRCPQRTRSWRGDAGSAEDSGHYSPRFPRARVLAWFSFPSSSAHHWMKISRMIGAAHERTGGDIEKPFSARNVAEVIELLRGDVFDHG